MKFAGIYLGCLILCGLNTLGSAECLLNTRTSIEFEGGVTKTVTVSTVDISICNEIHHLFDGSVYLKSVCTATQGINYEQADSVCKKAGMHLLVINNLAVQNALLEVAGKRFLDRDYARLWVNGEAKTVKWFTYDPEEKPIFEGLAWNNGGNSSGPCLSILRNNRRDKFTFSGWQCSGAAWGYCEYYNAMKEDRTFKW